MIRGVQRGAICVSLFWFRSVSANKSLLWLMLTLIAAFLKRVSHPHARPLSAFSVCSVCLRNIKTQRRQQASGMLPFFPFFFLKWGKPRALGSNLEWERVLHEIYTCRVQYRGTKAKCFSFINLEVFRHCKSNHLWYLLSLSSHTACGKNRREKQPIITRTIVCHRNVFLFSVFFHVYLEQLLVWARVSLPLVPVFIGCAFSKPLDLKPHRKLPLVWAWWLC